MNPQGIAVGYPIAIFHLGIKTSKEKTMLGWMIVFALVSALGALFALNGATAIASMKITSLIFASLFLLGLLTYAIRGRAR
jgi:hypothetical protein